MVRRELLVLCAFAMGLWGCTQTRQVDEPRVCVDYPRDLAPVVNAACGACHAAGNSLGGYTLNTYGQLLTPGNSGERPIDVGNINSPLLRRVRGENHPEATTSVVRALEHFVVDCAASYFATDAVHPTGFLNPSDPSFHGKALEASGYDFAACAKCHGAVDDLHADASKKPCRSCHEQGVTQCSTCHGGQLSTAPPRDTNGNIDRQSRGVGAHPQHVLAGPILGQSLSCDTCHITPTTWDAVGHIFLADGTLDRRPAEVVLGSAAAQNLTTHPERRSAPPSYDPVNLSCSNVYCHASTVNVGDPVPFYWTLGSGRTGCEQCHAPAALHSTHPNWVGPVHCAICHQQVANSAGQIVDASQHMDTHISVGLGTADCSACHGSNGNPLPPPGRAGEMLPSSRAVGAHAQHLSASEFMGALSCEVCHAAVPAGTFTEQIFAHIDGDGVPEVFRTASGTLLSGLVLNADASAALAAAGGATAIFDRTSDTCAVSCHGGSSSGANDTAPGVERAPRWTDPTSTPVICGSCHGIPPQSPAHPSSFGLNQCVLCHSTTVDATGDIQFAPDGTTTHINGVVEVN